MGWIALAGPWDTCGCGLWMEPAPRRTPSFLAPVCAHPEPDNPKKLAGVWSREPKTSPALAIA